MERGVAASKVARDPFDFPVAVAGRIWSAASIHLGGLFVGFALEFGAPGLCFDKRSAGGGAELSRRSVCWWRLADACAVVRSSLG
jgi:hypothetical protein